MKDFKLDVYGQEWDVKYNAIVTDPRSGGEACGLCDKLNRIIWISSRLDKHLRSVTLIHEMFHAYTYRCGIYNTGMPHEQEEIIADQFATMICENFDFNV